MSQKVLLDRDAERHGQLVDEALEKWLGCWSRSVDPNVPNDYNFLIQCLMLW